MGVPALFRWLTGKYEKITTKVIEQPDNSGANPNGVEFDNLYLDMNGIIHPCCHPENRPAPKTEQEMFIEIFKYIDRIVAMIRPRKLLYMAIDGVAPRAKMNQQRSRRFRSAREMAEKEESNEKESNEDESELEPNNDKNSMIMSDASVPSEGEHKIMDYIRRQRSDPNHDTNIQHVIYGLDADLIMLALATHEPNFRILREDVFYMEQTKRFTCEKCQQVGHITSDCPNDVESSNQPQSAPLSQPPFIFLHVSVLREYLEVEMRVENAFIPFELERALDDWVFLCFFVGNDFLPHLPSLEIREGAIDSLIGIYKRRFNEMGGYITKDGFVDLKKVAILAQELGSMEDQVFQQRKEREERRNKMNAGSKSGNSNATNGNSDSKPNQEDESDSVKLWMPGWKERFYREKFGVELYDKEFIASLVKSYVQGLCWVLGYYYQGCPSWKWFYPYHYAPFASDLIDIASLDIDFELGVPFKPLEQLMAVLPSASSALLPSPLQQLMNDETSQIIDFYPQEFSIDLNGKKHAWQGVALLPFIDEKRLLDAIEKVDLSDRDLELNVTGYDELYANDKCSVYEFLCGLYTNDETQYQPLDPKLTQNMCGWVLKNPNVCLPGSTFPSPLSCCQEITDSHVISAIYLPPKVNEGEIFKSGLLLGAKLAEAQLDKYDIQNVRQGRRRRGDYHSMHREYSQSNRYAHVDSYKPRRATDSPYGRPVDGNYDREGHQRGGYQRGGHHQRGEYHRDNYEGHGDYQRVNNQRGSYHGVNSQRGNYQRNTQSYHGPQTYHGPQQTYHGQQQQNYQRNQQRTPHYHGNYQDNYQQRPPNYHGNYQQQSYRPFAPQPYRPQEFTPQIYQPNPYQMSPNDFNASQPSVQPYGQPSVQPYGQPSVQPYGQPSVQPYGQPSVQPYGQPQSNGKESNFSSYSIGNSQFFPNAMNPTLSQPPRPRPQNLAWARNLKK